MRNHLVIGGGRGIGRALVEHLAAQGDRVLATVREPSAHPDLKALLGPENLLAMELSDEGSIREALSALSVDRLHSVVHVAGLLHDGDLQPEKRLEHVEPEHLARLFAINATAPLLVAKHVAARLRHDERAVFASLSARVGSIGDNRSGGWYGYRASKAAQNMFTRTLAIEWKRRLPRVIVVGLHPGTVATDLSEPFRGSVPPEKLFSVERAAAQLWDVMEALEPAQSGSVLAWDGTVVPP